MSSINLIMHTTSKVVAEQVLQSTACLGRKDRNLRVRIQLICSCREEQLAAEIHKTSTTTATRLIDTKKFVASDFLPWTHSSFLIWKWSFLIAMRAVSKPPYEGFKKLEDNISENHECPMKIWSSQIRPTNY